MKTQSIKLTKRVSNSRKTQTTELASNCNIHCNIKKLKGERKLVEKKSAKNLNAEKLKGGRTPLGFFNIQSVAKHQKIEVNLVKFFSPFDEFFFRKKVSQCRNKTETLTSRYVRRFYF